MSDTTTNPNEQSNPKVDGNAGSERSPAQPAPAPAGVVAAEPAPSAVPAPAASPPASADMATRLESIEWSVKQGLATLKTVEQQANVLAEAMDGLTKQVSFLPPQIRQMGGKLDGLGATITEPKYRGLLTGLLGLYDLVDQTLRSAPATGPSDPQGDHRRNYEVLRTQIRQLLAANEIEEIAASGAFDPALHRAIRRVETEDAARVNQIVEVVRAGFRSEQNVLRYADVVVGTLKATQLPVAP